jgi:hypothetical protein
MDKKKTRKSRATKSVRDLPVKAVNPKSAKGVRGGGDISVTKSTDKSTANLYKTC